MSMALQVFIEVMALVWQHPLVSCLLVLLFTPPFFPIVRFFSPLLISTALFMLALFTVGPQSGSSATGESYHGEENWEFRRVADVKVWEDKSVGDKRGKSDGSKSWMDWVRGVQEAGWSWVEAKLTNQNWQRSAVNDDNVHILQEASWAKSDPNTSGASTSEEKVIVTDARVPAALAPSALFRVDSKLKEFAMADLGEQAAANTQRVKRHASSIHHEPLSSLEIPKQAAAVVTEIKSVTTDLEDSPGVDKAKSFLLRRNAMGASSGLSLASDSDADTSTAELSLSKSGRLKQIEMLGEVLEHIEHAEKTGEELPSDDLAVLKPTTAQQVEDVKEKLEGFTHSSGEIKPVNASASNPKVEALKKPAPGSPLFKGTEKKKPKKKSSDAFSDDDSSSGEEELSDSDSSDSEFEIFPPVDPKKIKLHPPVKLDIQQLEKKLGTSLSPTPPKGEITALQ